MREQILALKGERPIPGEYADDTTLIRVSELPGGNMFRIDVHHKAGEDAHHWSHLRTKYLELEDGAWWIRDDAGGLHSGVPRDSFPDWRDAVLNS